MVFSLTYTRLISYTANNKRGNSIRMTLSPLFAQFLTLFTIETGKVVKSSFEIRSRVIDFLYHVVKFFNLRTHVFEAARRWQHVDVCKNHANKEMVG